ncbi:MAG: homoserine O-acetyltransferase [Xanthomonadales bacterium]|nr:homoserine O-acetyltransferase [Xanthomonadales bacterium]
MSSNPPGLRLYTPASPLLLESGEALAAPTIGFHTWGKLNARRDNVIWVCHALTASSDVASWWSSLFGPGKVIDPQRYFIVCANALGSCYGSIGPSSVRADGRRWGADFPEVTIGDLVSHQQLLFEHLGLRGIELVLGGSMGGFQALEWARREPNRVRRLALVASSWRQPADAVALAELQSAIVRLDPLFNDGRYEHDQGPQQGLALARQLGHHSYRSDREFDRRFGRQRREDGRLQVLSYLDHQGQKLVKRFDANSYLRLNGAMNGFDLAARLSPARALAAINTPTLVVSISSDRLYPPREQAQLARLLPQAELLSIDSTRGHDGFLADAAAFEADLRRFLQGGGGAIPLRPGNVAPARAPRPVALIGATGRVGGALLPLLAAQGERYQLVAVANRGGLLVDPAGLSPGSAAARLSGDDASLRPLSQAGRLLPTGTAIIDATAAAQVAGSYPEWLDQGHALVAANKLAFAGPQWPRLQRHQRQLGISAVVGAGLPILSSVRRLRNAGDRLLGLQASLSGTLNFVLDQLHLGVDFSAAVEQAVALGLAEPDPAADLQGEDVARKLLVILRAADIEIDRERISLAPLVDPALPGQAVREWLNAAERHWRPRIDQALAEGRRWVYRAQFDGSTAQVGPVAVALDHPLAQTRAAANLALLETEFHRPQPLLVAGNGAGPKVTAAALLADLAELPAAVPAPAESVIALRRIA